MDPNSFVGKDTKDLERAFGFTFYLELKDWTILGENYPHKSVVEAFFAYLNDTNDKIIKVVKTDNGTITEFKDMGQEEIRANLLQLGDGKGKFYDDDFYISYAFLGKNFFAYVLPSMLMFSASESNSGRMAEILDRSQFKYFAHEIKNI